jgi:hypothetical protein
MPFRILLRTFLKYGVRRDDRCVFAAARGWTGRHFWAHGLETRRSGKHCPLGNRSTRHALDCDDDRQLGDRAHLGSGIRPFASYPEPSGGSVRAAAGDGFRAGLDRCDGHPFAKDHSRRADRCGARGLRCSDAGIVSQSVGRSGNCRRVCRCWS